MIANIPNFPSNALAVTPNDSTNFDDPATIYVGGAGVVRVQPWDNADPSTVDFTMVAGGVVPCRVKRVYAAGTTATLLVRIW